MGAGFKGGDVRDRRGEQCSHEEKEKKGKKERREPIAVEEGARGEGEKSISGVRRELSMERGCWRYALLAEEVWRIGGVLITAEEGKERLICLPGSRRGLPLCSHG